MRLNPFSKKRPAPNSDLPRSPVGQFSSREPPNIAKTVQTETSAISGTLNVLTEINKLIASQNELVNSRVESILEGYGEPEPDGMGWIAILQQIAPYVAPYLPQLLEKYAGVTPSAPGPPSSSPPAESPSPSAGLSAKSLIEMAANHSPTEIKAALRLQGYSELEKQGISQETFKQAIQNIAKAV